MSLQEISLKLDLDAMPESVSNLIEEADRRMDKFYDEGLGLRYPNYVPCDPKVVHAAMAYILESGYLRGMTFCEWGCGFAMASGMAALLGMKAYGIEIEEEIADRAAQLMDDLNIPVEFLLTSYLPEGYEQSEGVGGRDLISPEATTPSGGVVFPPEYDGLDPDEVDLFFVYPWPDQEEMMMDLFAEVATHGAILLMYQGDGDIAAFLHENEESVDEDF